MDRYFFLEFTLAITPTVSEGVATGKQLPALRVQLQQITSGRKAEVLLVGYRLNDVPTRIEALVLKAFPDSQTARRIRDDRGMRPCRLKSEWSETLSYASHKALRTSCDSEASSFWHTWLGDLSPILFGMLWHRTRAALGALECSQDKPLEVRQVVACMKTAWAAVFREGARFYDARPDLDRLVKTEAITNDWPLADLERLRPSDLNALARQAYLSSRVLNYLGMDDWLGIVYYAVVDPVEDVAATC